MGELKRISELEIGWEWQPRPPETLIADVEQRGLYAFECVGIVPVDEEGGETIADGVMLTRVWIPYPDMENVPRYVRDRLEERHGVYAEPREYQKLDGFTGRGSQLR